MMISPLHQRIILVALSVILVIPGWTQDQVPRYGITEITFRGSYYRCTDNPVRDIEFYTLWEHASGSTAIRVHGFYDGDGQGNTEGDVFKVRFCPTETGTWKLVDIVSNDPLLHGQNKGMTLSCTASDLKGFWMPDSVNGRRWYVRSNGDHAYIIGNTLYSFLSEYYQDKATGGTIASDVLGCAGYVNKIRFAVTADRFPHPKDKPFLTEDGSPTDDGNYSHRPNPAWFSKRVDQAVRLCFENDVIADLILNGPDAESSRSVLHPRKNDHDCSPFLKYMAARYGSFPNVWICLSNEYNIRKPRYLPDEIAEIGGEMSRLLSYPTPLSVHGDQGPWDGRLNRGNWNDHVIVQNKIKYLDNAADFNQLNYWIGDQKPVINDELAYEGKGDGWVEADVIEAVLGAFAGGGYASTGYKTHSKGGHYFSGNFNAGEHRSMDNLLWLRQVIDNHIRFWEMHPAFVTEATYKDDVEGSRSSIFFQLDKDFRVLEREGHQYVLATNKAKHDILAYLPEGNWEIRLFDCISKEETLLAGHATGIFRFSSPDSRACLFVLTRE